LPRFLVEGDRHFLGAVRDVAEHPFSGRVDLLPLARFLVPEDAVLQVEFAFVRGADQAWLCSRLGDERGTSCGDAVDILLRTRPDDGGGVLHMLVAVHVEHADQVVPGLPVRVGRLQLGELWVIRLRDGAEFDGTRGHLLRAGRSAEFCLRLSGIGSHLGVAGEVEHGGYFVRLELGVGLFHTGEVPRFSPCLAHARVDVLHVG
jgi:hypothetical protein